MLYLWSGDTLGHSFGRQKSFPFIESIEFWHLPRPASSQVIPFLNFRLST
jgi:hypothetical protein